MNYYVWPTGGLARFSHIGIASTVAEPDKRLPQDFKLNLEGIWGPGPLDAAWEGLIRANDYANHIYADWIFPNGN